MAGQTTLESDTAHCSRLDGALTLLSFKESQWALLVSDISVTRDETSVMLFVRYTRRDRQF